MEQIAAEAVVRETPSVQRGHENGVRSCVAAIAADPGFAGVGSPAIAEAG
jgi:hypothetical protein